MFLTYQSGDQYLADNNEIFQKYPLETIFFVEDAKNLPDMSNGFAVKAKDGEKYLFAIRYLNFPMALFGDGSLCGELAEGLIKNNLSFGGTLCEKSLSDAFFKCYEAAAGGSHRILHSMDIMKCSCVNDTDTSLAEIPSLSDSEEIIVLMDRFCEQTGTLRRKTDVIRSQIESGQFAVVRRDGKIVSAAKKTRGTESLCSISGVFTIEEYRGEGLATQTVTYLTKSILNEGKLAYLFVDKANPISNHLYQSIGYQYYIPQTETQYIP